MDEWTPQREEAVDDDSIERELDRLQEEEARFNQPSVVEVVNGTTQEAHGPFGMFPSGCPAPTAALQLSSEAKFEELLHRLMSSRTPPLRGAWRPSSPYEQRG